MAVPSKNWVVINDSQVDQDSPVDGILMTAYRDDLVHLREWLGMSYTAAQNHNHDGVNSAAFTIPGNSLTIAMLKMTAGSWSGAASGILTINRYAHNLATSVNGSSGSTIYIQYAGYSTGTNTGRQEQIYVNGTFADNCSVYWDYHAT